MNKYLFLILAVTTSFLLSCGKDDDIAESESGNKESEEIVDITASDEVIGVRQQVILSVNYRTDNPNILVTWYEDGEKLNSIPRSELSIDWNARKVGEHYIEVAITDRENIVRYQKSFSVVETELAGAIIGDSKSKIARTFGVEEQDVMSVKESMYVTNTYYFSEDKLYRIFSVRSVPMTPKNKTDYMQPISTFSAYYYMYKEKYGEPTEESYTQLDTSESKIIEYGGHILSGGMAIYARFQNDIRYAELQIGPYTKGGYGYTLYQTLTER